MSLITIGSPSHNFNFPQSSQVHSQTNLEIFPRWRWEQIRINIEIDKEISTYVSIIKIMSKVSSLLQGSRIPTVVRTPEARFENLEKLGYNFKVVMRKLLFSLESGLIISWTWTVKWLWHLIHHCLKANYYSIDAGCGIKLIS